MRVRTALVATLLLATTVAAGADRPRVFLIDVQGALADQPDQPDQPQLKERSIRVVSQSTDEFEWQGAMNDGTARARVQIDCTKGPTFVDLSLQPGRSSAGKSFPFDVRLSTLAGERAVTTIGDGPDAWRFTLESREMRVAHWKMPEYAKAVARFAISPTDAMERMAEFETAKTGQPPPLVMLKHYLLVGDQYLVSREPVDKLWKGIALSGYCVDANTGEVTVVRHSLRLTDKHQKALFASVFREYHPALGDALGRRYRKRASESE